MARRRRRQAKKVGGADSDQPAEESDLSVAEEEASQYDSLQKEDSGNHSGSKEDISSGPREGISLLTVVANPEALENGEEKMDEDNMQSDCASKSADNDSMETEHQELIDASVFDKSGTEESQASSEKTDSALSEPTGEDIARENIEASGKTEEMTKSSNADCIQRKEVSCEKVDTPAGNVADVEVETKNIFEGKMEEDVPPVRIEKEPTKPYCFDDDHVPVAVDPEGDEGEVLIGNESPDFLKYWRAVLENPHDFTNWTYLLQLVEQENKPPLARRAYNGFFKRYPLCYGYWKKFSELEKRCGNLVRAQRILERGVRAIPLSIDLWVHMIDFYMNFYKGPDAGSDKVRKVFERAIAASGEEFRSEKLWNKYLQWEKDNLDLKAVLDIYTRVLKLPTQHYAVFFKDFKEFVQSHSSKDLLTLEEFEVLLGEVREDAEKSERKSSNKEISKEVDTADDTDPPGVEASDRGKPPNDKELKAVGDKLIEKKKKVFEETEEIVTKIWNFEEGIKRPYFHVKALERTQIKNWRDYLESEMNEKDNHSRVVLLFERCLIACALYEDFWLKYARYLMKTDPQKARDVYRRACEIHLPKKPNIHLHWASFEEQLGNYEAAANILSCISEALPNLVMVKLRLVAVERRAGHLMTAEELLKQYAENAGTTNEEAFFIRKYAWFLTKVSKKVDVARQVLEAALTKHTGQLMLYHDLVGLEFSCGSEETICHAFDLALESQLSDEVKFHFSQRKLEYLEDFGMDAKTVQKAYDDHQKLFRSHKKRLQNQSDSQPASKKAKVEQTTTSGGSKIQTTGASRQTYSAKPTTNGAYATQVTAQAPPTAAIQTTNQTYQQAASGDQSVYYQNYWNYQTQKPEQYQYGQWTPYSQQTYYQQ